MTAIDPKRTDFSLRLRLVAPLATRWHAQSQRMCGICRLGVLRLPFQGIQISGYLSRTPALCS